MAKTELEYSLQKARALVTELRVTLETIIEIGNNDMPEDSTNYCTVEDLEEMLDEHPNAGEGFVRVSVEPFKCE